MNVCLPIACLFLIVGLLLTGYGLVVPSAQGEVSLGVNVNLYWGSVMVLFAGVMLWAGTRRRVRDTERKTRQS